MLFAPDGSVIQERQKIHWPLGFMRMLAIFARNCDDTDLGVRCERCKEMLHGTNAREDNYWTMECACRTYIGQNPVKDKFRVTH